MSHVKTTKIETYVKNNRAYVVGIGKQGPPGRDGVDGALMGDVPDERVITANGTLEQELTPLVDFVILFENNLL